MGKKSKKAAPAPAPEPAPEPAPAPAAAGGGGGGGGIPGVGAVDTAEYGAAADVEHDMLWKTGAMMASEVTLTTYTKHAGLAYLSTGDIAHYIMNAMMIIPEPASSAPEPGPEA